MRSFSAFLFFFFPQTKVIFIFINAKKGGEIKGLRPVRPTVKSMGTKLSRGWEYWIRSTGGMRILSKCRWLCHQQELPSHKGLFPHPQPQAPLVNRHHPPQHQHGISNQKLWSTNLDLSSDMTSMIESRPLKKSGNYYRSSSFQCMKPELQAPTVLENRDTTPLIPWLVDCASFRRLSGL